MRQVVILLGLCLWAAGELPGLPVAVPTGSAAEARLADGIYFASLSGAGTPIERLDGQKIYFSGLATSGFGKPSLTSTTHDNSLCRLDLEGAGPFPDVAGPPHLALDLECLCQSFVSQSDRRSDGSMDLTCFVPGDVAAKDEKKEGPPAAPADAKQPAAGPEQPPVAAQAKATADLWNHKIQKSRRTSKVISVRIMISLPSRT
jgi:hypothetical protein